MLSNSFKWKHFVGEIILLNVRWYLKRLFIIFWSSILRLFIIFWSLPFSTLNRAKQQNFNFIEINSLL